MTMLETKTASAELQKIVEKGNPARLEEYIISGKSLAGSVYVLDDGTPVGALSYFLIKNMAPMVEVFAHLPHSKFNEAISDDYLTEAMMATDCVLSEDFLKMAFQWMSNTHIQAYLMYGHVSRVLFIEYLDKMDFRTLLSHILKTDDSVMLVKMLSVDVHYKQFIEVVKNPFQSKNIWLQCIENYAVSCEEVVKNKIQQLRKAGLVK